MELLKVEHALCNAVAKQRDFYHCAEYIGGIVGKLSIKQSEKEELLRDLKDFFDNYSPGPSQS